MLIAFHASVVYPGRAWQGTWSIRHGIHELEADACFYPTEDTARVMVEVDARNHGYRGRVKWEDGDAADAV